MTEPAIVTGHRPDPRRRASTALPGMLAILLFLPLVPTGAAAQVVQAPPDRPIPPPFYAITDARIVTGAGPVIENGVVVIAHGVIRAVGTDVEIPPEAWVIDAEGMSVYPGLFDALSDLGLQGDQNGQQRGGGGSGSPFRTASNQEPAEGPEDRPATHPWRTAAEALSADDDRLERWRKGGFTNAMVAPDEGIVAGQGAVIALAGDENRMVVATPAALRVNLRSPGGFGSYPGSLFGVMSYLEQLFLDAERYAQARQAYEGDPRGVERPRFDRTLEPIQRAVSEGWPVLVEGDDAKEIRRAIELGNDLGVRTVVVGAQGAWENADEIAAAGVPVLVSLDWPERTRDADPEGEETLRSMRRRANAPTTPRELEEAGVSWAFYSGGVGTPGEVLKKAGKAVEAGLSEEAALRGLTLGPARIYGVADRMGTIEPGKIANLIVTDGPLFDEKTKVKLTFVDGNKFEVREPERPEEPPAADMSGSWTLTVESPQGIQEVRAELEMAEDGTLTGTLTGTRGEQPITDGWVSGEKFRFTATLAMGPRTMEVTYTGTFEGDEMEGTASAGGRFSMDFRGTRESPPEGGAR